MARAIILLLDSFGIGGAPDANLFGDSGANTLGQIKAAYGYAAEYKTVGVILIVATLVMPAAAARQCAHARRPKPRASWAACGS